MEQSFLDILQSKTEAFLTWRKRRKLWLKEKQRRKNQVLDWVEAFLSAVVIVFFINQYLFQAYQIPSESMVKTLNIGDRIFVDKLTYGPELLPGIVKFPGFRDVKRSDIIIFESPEYRSKGPVYDIITRIVYMMTFSFIDLDKDESGKPLVHFLVKRAIGVDGDRIKDNKGLMEIRPKGASVFYPEAELKKQMGLPDTLNARMYIPAQYADFRELPVWFINKEKGLPVSSETEKAFAKYYVLEQNPASGKDEPRLKDNYDSYYFDKISFQTHMEISPQEYMYRKEFLMRDIGRYIPPNFVFPMGDNRDNSKDGRFFGPIQERKVLGKSAFRFWPLYRFGGV
jgi:signal peptidase I